MLLLYCRSCSVLQLRTDAETHDLSRKLTIKKFDMASLIRMDSSRSGSISIAVVDIVCRGCAASSLFTATPTNTWQPTYVHAFQLSFVRRFFAAMAIASRDRCLQECWHVLAILDELW